MRYLADNLRTCKSLAATFSVLNNVVKLVETLYSRHVCGLTYQSTKGLRDCIRVSNSDRKAYNEVQSFRGDVPSFSSATALNVVLVGFGFRLFIVCICVCPCVTVVSELLSVSMKSLYLIEICYFM